MRRPKKRPKNLSLTIFFSGAYEVLDSESSDESEEDDETEVVELEEDVEYKSNRIIPADHVIQIEDPPVDDRRTCDVCQVTISKRSYSKHIKELHFQGKKKCNICGGQFIRQVQLEKYVYTVGTI